MYSNLECVFLKEMEERVGRLNRESLTFQDVKNSKSFFASQLKNKMENLKRFIHCSRNMR